jgi:hypothetical protein
MSHQGLSHRPDDGGSTDLSLHGATTQKAAIYIVTAVRMYVPDVYCNGIFKFVPRLDKAINEQHLTL